uniref:MGAT4 conserved region domain-containing protein n=1 Tax=Castor canadensis TaxID=51338 RepID=A0A8C0XLS2_CASCN
MGRIVWQIIQEQMSSEIQNHLKVFMEMQIRSPLLQHSSYTVLAGAPPQKKKLLTVGISTVLRPHGSYLLDTLQSLFQGSSEHDLEYTVVLVCLSDPDPAWLSQTVANISGLFAPHIEAQKLLMISGFLGGSLLKKGNHTSPCEGFNSRQKEDYALLMNFASNLSDYFLLMEDNVQCSPRFLSAIYWTLSAWKDLPWVMLEFSNLRASGKVFHTRDLSRLTSFFLLFHSDTPPHLLLSEFRLLLDQNVPIRFSSSIFSHVSSYSEFEDRCFPEEKEVVFGDPDNPTAVVLTNMFPGFRDRPQHAYTLNEDYFSTVDAQSGNYVTVILDRPQKIIRVAVLTGFKKKRMYQLHQGQVLLGYGLTESPRYCAHYILLGPLVRGSLDQRVYYEEDSVEKLSCIKLLVLSQEALLLIRQIKVWTEPEEEEEES